MVLETWEIDTSHSGVHFSVRHLVIAKVRGQFARWSGTVLAQDGDFSSAQIEVAIESASINTGLEDRDTHLKAADFFDVVRYPRITFKGKRVETPRGHFDGMRVAGDLTIRGVTRELVLDVHYSGRTKDPWGKQRAGFTAKASIDRKDFGLTWNQPLEGGGVLVSDRVEIEIEAEIVKQVASKAA
jgi:polyisoprenoid-binding protein YceI